MGVKKERALGSRDKTPDLSPEKGHCHRYSVCVTPPGEKL